MAHETNGLPPTPMLAHPFPPSSPNPSLTSSTKEDIEKWRHLSENHHESCDLTKCLGKRVNGLYVCQFSNMPGNIYSQYLRHCRRQGAYKTKPCRNFYGPSRHCPAGDHCSFYHGPDEKRELPQPPPLTPTMLTENGGMIAASDGLLIAEQSQEFSDFSSINMPPPATMFIDNNHHNGHHRQVDNLLDNLIIQVQETYQRLQKQAASANDYLRANNTISHLEQQFTQWRINSDPTMELTPTNTNKSSAILQQSRALASQTKNKRSGPMVERWYSAGGIKPASTTTSWEGYSATSSSSRSTSPPHTNGFSSYLSPRFARGKAVWDRVLIQQQHQQFNQSHHHGEFGKSFHPFGESYPLKNALSSANHQQ